MKQEQQTHAGSELEQIKQLKKEIKKLFRQLEKLVGNKL